MFFTLFGSLVRFIQSHLVPICFVCAWGFTALTVWRVYATIRDSVNRAKEMHQIPCANCQFFTGDYNLKCTVHPMNALSEDAINCPDYYPTQSPYSGVAE